MLNTLRLWETMAYQIYGYGMQRSDRIATGLSRRIQTIRSTYAD